MITKTRNIPDGKALLKTLPYEPYLEAERLYYPITSGRCPEGSASVKVGEKVYVGQIIGARRSGFFDQNIHSTVSGTVVGFEMRTLSSGKKVECIVVVGLLSGRLLGPTFYMGTAGAIASLIVMGTLKQLKVFGMTLVSLIGSISHQIGQIVAGIFVIGATEVFYYLPIMLPIGVVSGIIIGLIAEKFMVTMKNNERRTE